MNCEDGSTVLKAKWLCPCSLEGADSSGCRIDMRIDHLVLVENKRVEKILPIHVAQLLIYLKLSGLSLGLMISWNVILLRDVNPASPKPS